VELAAAGVTAPCEDLNVLTARALPRPEVALAGPGAILPPQGGLLCLFALDEVGLNGAGFARHDLGIAQEPVAVAGRGQVLAVRLFL
jgi:hypothetical protein